MSILVTVTGVGSVWRRRFGRNPDDARRFARAAYYNTTGVPVDGEIRTRSRIAGHARFNGVGGFDPNAPQRILNTVFECAEPCVWQGQNKILFRRMLRIPEQPDYLLVVVRSWEAGRLDVGSRGWKSEGTLLLSFSECRDRQEAMLLMPPLGWLRTAVGTYRLCPFIAWPWTGRLQLESLNGGT
jgi:hypothetical protein